MINVLMVGVDRSTKGGMWSVAENYLQDTDFSRAVKLSYVATASSGGLPRRAACFGVGFVRIWWKLLFDKPDVVHLHTSERGSVLRKALIARMAKRVGSKVVLHMHGAEFQTWYASLGSGPQKRVGNFLNGADRILILGEYWRSFIAELVDDKSKICILYNAVHVPERNAYSSKASKLLFLGEVGARKGVYDLLEAVKRIDDQLPVEAQLLLYGTNPDGDIQKRICNLGLDNRVRYCGWADREKKKDVFSQTAVNILPSYHEGLPMTILEAMAHGIPCISTDVAAIPEAVDDQCGQLIQPGDVPALAEAILGLSQDAAARQQMSKNAHLRAKKLFSMEAHMYNLLQMYAELLGRNV